MVIPSVLMAWNGYILQNLGLCGGVLTWHGGYTNYNDAVLLGWNG